MYIQAIAFSEEQSFDNRIKRFMSVDSSANVPQRINSINHVGRQAWSCSKNCFERLILRKQMGTLQVEIDIDNQLRRSVTIVQLIGIGIGCTIGK